MSWGAYFAVMFATALKFIAGPITGFSLGLAWYETVIFTWLGAILTVTFIVSMGQIILKSLTSLRKTKPLLFSKGFVCIQIWQKFGIKGIAALTPLIFTPIGGSFLALSFKVPLPRILIFMAISSILWALLYTGLIYQLRFLRDWIQA